MVSATEMALPSVIPPNFLGKWRMNINAEFDVDGTKKMECIRVYYDIVEM